MRLTKSEIRKLYDKGELKIAFIGMSNIGKSMTAKRLANAYEFTLIDIDHEIQKILGKDSMEAFAKWQGQPYEDGYKEREAKSLELETQAMMTAMQSVSGNVILDTAGSVIYTSDEAQQFLKNEFLVVQIKAGRADIKRLQDIYYTSPKPLAWAGHYKPNSKFSPAENIQKCYPKLLKARAKLYDDLADQDLKSKFIMEASSDVGALFQALGS